MKNLAHLIDPTRDNEEATFSHLINVGLTSKKQSFLVAQKNTKHYDFWKIASLKCIVIRVKKDTITKSKEMVAPY